MRRVTRSFAVAALATALAVVAGCSSDDEPEATNNAGTGGELVKVRYLTSFGNFGRDAYGWVALEKGFFREAGFDVEIQKGEGTGGNIQKIVAGAADYTPIDLTGGLLNFGKGTKGFTAVAAIQQRTMAAIATTTDKGIKTPKDLEGKTLVDAPGSVVRNLFPVYAQLAKIDYNKVTWNNGEPATLIGQLNNKNVDGIGQFVVGRPTIAAVTKKEPFFLPYSDYLIDLYGNVLITSTKNATDKPEEVKKFTAALLKGLEYSLANPAEAAKILKAKDQAANDKAAQAELELMGSFVRSAGSGEKIGLIDTQRVARSIAILQGAGQIPAGITPEQIISVDLVPKV
ncbi:ABC transporter substrate-binding protein [Phytohabitans sp. LJ34]|uniref:ABC transporter substrate-binding protein n=1 Tax=Phytohabitans sp. LJ34 TaxID=3452217 RepID=UPI003F8A188D